MFGPHQGQKPKTVIGQSCDKDMLYINVQCLYIVCDVACAKGEKHRIVKFMQELCIRMERSRV